MKLSTANFIIAMIELALKYGVPATLEIITKWDVEEPTVEDIELLRLKVPEPATYFKEL